MLILSSGSFTGSFQFFASMQQQSKFDVNRLAVTQSKDNMKII